MLNIIESGVFNLTDIKLLLPFVAAHRRLAPYVFRRPSIYFHFLRPLQRLQLIWVVLENCFTFHFFFRRLVVPVALQTRSSLFLNLRGILFSYWF